MTSSSSNTAKLANAVLVLASLLGVSVCVAQDKNAVRIFAKTLEAKLVAAGEPRDRCALGASFADGAIVIRATNDSKLKAGDRLLSIDHTSLAGKTAEDVTSVLRGLAPDAAVTLVVSRDGSSTTLPVTCNNARPVIEPMANAISLAARGKFDECVDVLGRMTYVDRSVLLMRAQCAAVSKKSKAAYPSILADALSLEVEDAGYAPGLRTVALSDLRSSEGVITNALGASRFDALVSATRQWKDGGQLYDQSAPDWATFRSRAESALRAKLIDPESARFEWDYGFLLGYWKPMFAKKIDGYWTCGRINARNRMGGYTGSTAFVVVLDPSGFVKYSEMGDATNDYDFLTMQCSNSAKLLPRPPLQLTSITASPHTEAASASIADELKKLVELRDSGALTESEFQAAKVRLLKN